MINLIEQLRALADALEPMARAPRFEDFDVPAFCAWVRACADAHPAPVAPQADIGRLRECAQRLVDGARWGLAGALSPSSKAHEIPSSAWSDVKSRHLASLRDALVVPQPEPKRPAFLDEIDRTKEHVASWPQWMKDATVSAAATLPVTEPKREPLSDEQIDEIGDPFGYFQYGDAQGDKRRAFARAVERAAYERAASLCDKADKSAHPSDFANAIRALRRQ